MKSGWIDWNGDKPKVKSDTYMVMDKQGRMEAMHYDKEKWEAFGAVAYSPVVMFPPISMY